MAKDFDNIFAKVALNNKLLSAEQVKMCLTTLKQLEQAGLNKPFALVAVDSDYITREKADKIVAAINQKMPGRHPALTATAKHAVAVEAAGRGATDAGRKAEAPSKQPERTDMHERATRTRVRSSGPRKRTKVKSAPKKEGGSKLLLILGAIVLVAAVGAALYFGFLRD